MPNDLPTDRRRNRAQKNARFSIVPILAIFALSVAGPAFAQGFPGGVKEALGSRFGSRNTLTSSGARSRVSASPIPARVRPASAMATRIPLALRLRRVAPARRGGRNQRDARSETMLQRSIFRLHVHEVRREYDHGVSRSAREPKRSIACGPTTNAPGPQNHPSRAAIT